GFLRTACPPNKASCCIALKFFTHVDHTRVAGASPHQFSKAKALVKTERARVALAQPEVRAGRTARPKFVDHLFHHVPTIATTLRAWQKINVKMRWKFVVRLRTKVIRIVI